MAVVDYGSIVKGGLQSFNEVDQYIKAEEQREYQNAKERRDHLYKSDRDKMADFWRDHQHQYKEYRDNVEDDRKERQFEETIRVNDHNIDMAERKQALAVRQQDEIEKQNKIKALIAAHNVALEQDKTMNKNKINAVNSRTGSTRGGSANGFVDLEKGLKASADAIIKNSDTPEQKRIAFQHLSDSITDENQKIYLANYYEYVTGLQQENTLKGLGNFRNAFKTVMTETVKDGKTPTGEQIAQDFAEYVNTNNQLDLQHAFAPSVEKMMVGTIAKDIVNGKEVILGEIGGFDPRSLRAYHIPETATVGLVGTFFVNGKPVNMIVTNLNGDPLAYGESLIKNIDTHLLESQVRSVVQNRNKNKLLTEKEFKNTYGSDDFSAEKYKEYVEKHKLEQAMPVKRYDKDLDVKTLKDAEAHTYEVNKAIQQSRNKPDTSVVSNIFTTRYNGVEKGDKVYIDDGKIVVPIGDEEQQEQAYLKSKSKEFFSKQLNEKDVAEVQQSKNLSKEKAIKYLHDEYLNKELDKFYRNNPELVEKEVKVNAISKGFQGDFSDNTFDILTNEQQNDYVYMNENTNKVISVAEFNKLPKEEQKKFEKTNISDIEDPFFEVAFNLFGPNKEEKLDVALRPFVPDEKNRKTFVNQYKKYKEERNSLRESAGGDEGAYLRTFFETKKSVGDKYLPKEKLEEMYRITERYKDLPLNDDDDGKANKEKLLSELKDAGLSGTVMYRRIKELETDDGKSVNSFKEKKYSYAITVEPKKKSQKLSDAISKQPNVNNGLGGYQSTSTSIGGIIKNKEYEGDFSNSLKARDNLMNFVGLNDLNQ